jgi:soluble lytic murein transglycosylase
MSPGIRRTFPQGDTSFALTGSNLLANAGLHRPSLYLAEVAGERIPAGVPVQLLPLEYRRLLYPQPYQPIVDRESQRQKIDPNLLNAIIREESRFDPLAISAASARGLTQFILPTARRVSGRLGWTGIEAVDLHRPEVAIALGAAYLAQLESLFDGRTEATTAAYNAGENQARLWADYCYSDQPEEYFTKVGFSQTRNYVRKVGSSQAQYLEIYSPSEIELRD